VQSSGSLGQTNVVGLYTGIVPTPLTFLQTSSLWIINDRYIHIESQPTSNGTTVVITSTDGTMSITLQPKCTYTLLYPQAKQVLVYLRSFSVLLTSLCRLSQARREELSLIGSQFWFFGLAVFAVSICATFLPLAIIECFLQLVFESIPHMYVRSPFETTSPLTGGIASPLSSPVCSPPGGRPTLCGAR